MDNIVDSLNKAYEEFILASASVLESKESEGGQKGSLVDAALENFREKCELFRVACDQAEEFVDSVKQKTGSVCLVDEASTGFTAEIQAKQQLLVPGLVIFSEDKLKNATSDVRINAITKEPNKRTKSTPQEMMTSTT